MKIIKGDESNSSVLTPTCCMSKTVRSEWLLALTLHTVIRDPMVSGTVNGVAKVIYAYDMAGRLIYQEKADETPVRQSLNARSMLMET